MHNPVYFEEYKSPSYWAQQRKGHPIRERIVAALVLVSIIGGDIIFATI